MAVDLGRLIDAYNLQVASTRRRTEAVVRAFWNRLPDHRSADIERFVQQVVPLVEGAQTQVAGLTDAYLAQTLTALTGDPVAPVGIPTEVARGARGVPAAEVYQRPGVTVWNALADGVPYREAVERGLARALDLTSTDLQLAKTHSAQLVMEDNDDVAGYRRVLTGTHSCGLCVVASTQRYHRGNLMPCHPGCDCGVLPIVGDTDPGQVINESRLEGAHERIAERFGVSSSDARDPIDYRDVLITHEHGELGPILGVRGQKFTGPNDL
jgi:hypothetical protein